MYIDYNNKIKIIATYLFSCKTKLFLKKYIISFFISMIINEYNKEYVETRINETSKNINSIYNKKQLEAIYTDEINNLVIAGPGSGKTTLIVGKVNYLIEEKKYKETEILCLSFTNNACNNLKQKLKYNVDVFTFHKLAKNILKENYRINNNYLSYVIDEYFYSYVKNNIRIKMKVLRLIKKTNIKKYDFYLRNGCFDNLKSTIQRFIELFICSGYDLKDLLRFKTNKRLMLIISDIYYLYINDMSAQNMLDLNQLIKEATRNIKNINNYKYIIIDEFQDISKLRFNLIKQIQKYTQARLLAVGDDFQSIYKFSGSNLDSYLEILKKKRKTKVIKLEINYRNCKELVYVSNKFIMKNKKQIRKRIITTKNIKKPIVIVKEKKDILIKLLKYIGNKKILVLGRNNNDINNYLSSNQKEEILKMKNIEYTTVHKAKGLESDVVIIINLEDKINGFPCQIRENKLLDKHFLKEDFYYDEERRLFYVGLTRTKNKVYLLEPSKPSIFLKEIKKDNRKYITFLDI